MKRICFVFLLSLMVIFPCACGYRMQQKLQFDLDSPEGIFVPLFENQTNEVGVEAVFTQALIRELISRREMVVKDDKNAGLLLRGKVETLVTAPTALADIPVSGLQNYKRLPSEYGIEIIVSFALNDKKTGKGLWTGKFRGYRRVDAPTDRSFDYQAASSVGLFTQSLVESIYPLIARDMMRDVYDEMVALF